MSTSQPIRNVVLEARSGPSSGFRLWIRPGQRVTVGRTDAADFSLKRDHRISGKHFALECQATQCLIRDLKSANGTWLNGQKIEHAVLEDGMLITVGATELRVTIETEPSPEQTPETALNGAADVLRTTESEFVEDEPPVSEPPELPAEPSTPVFEVARSRIRENSGVFREGQRPPQPPNSHEFGYSPSKCATSKTPVPALQQVCLEAVVGARARQEGLASAAPERGRRTHGPGRFRAAAGP
jgi:predicted component of type VI protein secretion system